MIGDDYDEDSDGDVMTVMVMMTMMAMMVMKIMITIMMKIR